MHFTTLCWPRDGTTDNNEVPVTDEIQGTEVQVSAENVTTSSDGTEVQVSTENVNTSSDNTTSPVQDWLTKHNYTMYPDHF